MSTITFEIRADSNLVEAWLDVRLPFEPKGALLEARRELHDAIRKMTPPTDRRFVAEYASTVHSFFDLENVLFYNVGTGAFRNITRAGLRCYRSHSAPPTSPTERSYPHYHRYSFEDRPVGPNHGALLKFRVPVIVGETKPHHFWWEASAGCLADGVKLTGVFGLVIEIPRNERNLAAVVKPLLDGIISAMHPASVVDELAVDRLVAATGWSASDVIQRLKAPAAPLLEPRQVLKRYRQFVKWDPADELCEEFAIIIRDDLDNCQVYARSLE